MLYIGNFLHLTNQNKQQETERRHGEFHLLVESESAVAALELFKRKIVEMRNTSTFFEGQSTIYLNQILGFPAFSDQEAVMVNFKSVAGDPSMPYIGCTLPTEDADDCRIYTWEGSRLVAGGKQTSLLIEFEAEDA